jgi:hypothetical protein
MNGKSNEQKVIGGMLSAMFGNGEDNTTENKHDDKLFGDIKAARAALGLSDFGRPKRRSKTDKPS